MEEKEIGKLLELLNEYIPNGWELAQGGNAIFYEGQNYTDRVFSKSFGFIQRLVENDKIDTDAYKTVYSGDLDKWKTLTMSSGGDEFYQVTEHGVYESLLMLLSISDTPIEDLISYLK